MKDNKENIRNINPFFVIQTDGEEQSLKQAYETLIKCVEFSHKPEDKPLELLVESCHIKNDSWVEISPKKLSKIHMLHFNPQKFGKYLRKVPEGIADVDYVQNAKCVEFSVGSTKYRVFARAGPKVVPKIDSEIPTAYHIEYKVRGGVWYDGFMGDKKCTPTQQIEILDKALLTLQQYTDLYYPIKEENDLYPCIRLVLGEFESVYNPSKKEDIIDEFTRIFIIYTSRGCLKNIVFKQKINLNDKAVVLAIHGGDVADFRIGKVDYYLEMNPEYDRGYNI